MEIGIDCSCVAKPERTGVARYCVSLLHQLPSVLGPDDRVTLLYRFSRLKRRRYFERIDDPRFRQAVFQDGFVPRIPRRLDVVHGPDVRIPVHLSVPGVSTVHDLSALELPGIARESFRRRKHHALGDVAERARLILCISEYTERVLLERFPAAAGRTRVVPLGLSPRFSPQDPERVRAILDRLGVGRRYLLFVGQISLRKNLPPLIEAFSRLGSDPELRDVQLVFAGPTQTGGDEIVQAALESPAGSRIRFLGFVADETLPALYAGAAAFCFTGKGEGFGLPILEAMASECPVLVGKAGANTSTAGGAGLLVDPDDPEEISAALARLVTDETLRADLVRRGVAHAHEYSWRKTVERTVDVYREAVASGAPS